MCISPSWLVSKLCFFPIQLWWFPMVPQCRQTSIHRFFSGETVKPPIYFPFGFGRGSHWFASTCFLIPQFCRGSLWRKPRKFFYHHMLWYPLWGQDSQRLKASAFLVSIWRSSMRKPLFFLACMVSLNTVFYTGWRSHQSHPGVIMDRCGGFLDSHGNNP